MPITPGDDPAVLPLRCLAVLALLAAGARAGTHRMARGETLEHVARAYGCSVQAVLRANGLDNVLVPAGRVVRVPDCRAKPSARLDAEERARRALAVIDGVAVVKRVAVHEPLPEPPRTGSSQSIGVPWNGRLENGRRMPHGEGYAIRRPANAYGADHVVEHLRRAIAEVRAAHPHVHTLAIGDLSDRDGGQLTRHRSHQSGLDVDVGLYFTRKPKGYPEQFVAANADLDLEATWALIVAFARTADRANGVQVILLDHAIQARLYRYAKQRGTPRDQLERLLQYPRDKDTLAGLVRHWPSHADHLHVRFKPAQ